MLLIKSLKEKSKSYNDPFPHWEINDPLSNASVNEICNAEIANPIQDNLEYDGTRAIDGGDGKFRTGITDGGKAKKYRCFITKENFKKFPNLKKFIDELCSKEVEISQNRSLGQLQVSNFGSPVRSVKAAGQGSYATMALWLQIFDSSNYNVSSSLEHEIFLKSSGI